MKTKMMIVLAVFFSLQSFGQTIGQIFASGGINYRITTATTVEVAPTAIAGVVSIPVNVSYNNSSFTVTSIGAEAFTDQVNLNVASIPNTITRIGDYAFMRCRNLTSINIPSTVEAIGHAAFADSGLTSIIIPNSITSIAGAIFHGCSSLSNITIPNSVTSLDWFAFAGCTSLTSINIPNSVNNIGRSVFQGCTGLTSIVIPNSVTTIGFDAFSLCSNLTSVTLPSSVTIIRANAFDNCSGLSSVSVSWQTPLSITRNVFENLNLSTIALNVPRGTEALYEAAPVWTEFGPISHPLPQYTAIPDNNFELALFNKGIDTVLGDNRVLTAAIINIPTLDVSNKGIADLTGIEAFYALTDLNCSGNLLTSLNINTVVLLQKLNCSENQIASLNLSNQTVLQLLRCEGNLLTTININGISTLLEVYCSNNLMTNLDLSAQTNLQKLYCNNNRLTNLNVTNGLTTFNCQANQLSQMDLRGFNVLTNFNCTLNPNLSCISVDDVAYANANYQKDATASFSPNCFGSITLNYCRGVIAPPLTSPFAAGVVSRWYTTAVGGRATLASPTPTTTTDGTRVYYVSQVSNGVESARIAITVNTLGLPGTPGAIAGTVAQGALVGTTTAASYSVAPVANATSYNWTVPAGVNIVSGQGTTTLTVNFNNVSAGAGSIGNLMVVAVNDLGCSTRAARILGLTKALPAAPTAIRLTDAGVVTTSIAKYLGQPTVLTLTATPVVGVTTYEWELPAGVTVLSGALPVRGGALGGNSITVNFEGVTTAGMFNYTTTSGILTHVLRIGVRSITGVGSSITSNASLLNPTTNNTARLLTLTAVAPKAPTTVRMTDAMAVDPTRAITVISTFIGTPKTLTLTATPVVTANEYSWELPAGVKQLSGGNSNVITVNFADVTAGTTSLYLGVKAMNGAGVSVTANASLIPATNSTARLLRLSATVPNTVPAVIGQVIALCGKNAYTYTISPSALATSYEITGPVGSKVTSKDKATNGSNVIKTSDLEFTVVYPEKFAATKETPASISVIAVNGVGKSPVARTIVVTTTVPTPTPEDIIIETQKARFRGPKAKIARRYSEPIIGNPNYSKWWKLRVVVNDGAEIVAEDIKTDEIEVDFSKVPPTVKSTKVFIYNSNSCGVLSLPLIQTIVFEPIAAKTAETLKIKATEVYPNPVVNDFTIDVTASKSGNLDIAIYSLEGIQVADSKTFELKEGANTITQNVSNLAKGIYIVQLLNSSNNEVITKKLIKN